MATATGICAGVNRADAALADTVQLPALTPEVPPLNFCAATARRLLEIARRNELRREAKLPLLPIAKELRRIKRQEELEEFERFEAVHAEAVWQEVLKPRREAEGDPNWRPSWMEGVSCQTQVNKISPSEILRGTPSGEPKFRGRRTPRNRQPLSKQFNGNVAEEAYRANRGYQCES